MRPSGERCDALAREISAVHHVDESRHLAFDRAYLTELCAQWLPAWDEAQYATFRAWLAGFLEASWGNYYNPTVYKDAGIENAYEVRQRALHHPAQIAHRREVQGKLVRFFTKVGLLAEEPAVL